MHTSFRICALRSVLVALAVLGAVGPADAMITVGPASDTACQYHDIGAAVQAAANSPGFDLVAVSGTTWSAQTTITDHDPDGLTIEGGFANCSAGISTGRTTLDGSGAVAAGPLIVHSGNGPLTLLHLILTNGKGAIQSVVAGPLTLSDVLVYFNNADYGGGLFVSGNDIFRMQLNLIGSSINSNTATRNGGGLYLSKVDVTISDGSNVVGNIAQGVATGSGDGGGIYALDSNIDIVDHSVPPFANVGSNYAQRNGGGIFFSSSQLRQELHLWNDRAAQPLWFDDNAASGTGGALYVSASGTDRQVESYADIRNVRFTSNESQQGAAIYAAASGSGSFGISAMVRLVQTVAGDVAPPCATGLECNAFDDNHATSGSIIDLSSGGGPAHVSLLMSRASMRNNRAEELIGGSGYMGIDSSLFASNELEIVAYNISHDLRVSNSTIAYNTMTGDEMFLVALPPASFELMHSLLVQSDANPVQASNIGAGVPVTVRDLGILNVGVGQGTNVQFLTDPFVDASNGDFHIRATSSAVDRWGPSGDPLDTPPTVDLDGAMRPYQFNNPTTPYDFGAYEADAVVDVIFRDGFDQ
jgi:hypothetical protein